mgnify:CR=1 FL=1
MGQKPHTRFTRGPMAEALAPRPALCSEIELPPDWPPGATAYEYCGRLVTFVELAALYRAECGGCPPGATLNTEAQTCQRKAKS